MLIYIGKRIVLAFLVAVAVSFISFMILNLSGDPAIALAGADASPEEIQLIREQYGLDRPILVQYVEWVGRALRGDFGESPYFNMPVKEIIGDRIGVTLLLGVCAFAFAICLAIPLGVIAAIRPNTWIDRTALTISVFGQALPNFFFGLMLIIFFGVTLQWLPISGDDTWLHFILPAVTLGYYASPSLMRLTRTGMLDVLASDYIRTAKAKGLKMPRVLFKHALRNAIIPVVSLAFVQFGFMLGGAFVIEYVFSINGIGFLAVKSIQRADLPVVQVIVLLLSVIYVTMTLVADVFNAFLDPRIRAK
jgi:peptide/nickel transport system permease protein